MEDFHLDLLLRVDRLNLGLTLKLALEPIIPFRIVGGPFATL
jgi:hypothetical protein